ncbi:MAG: hypothetical protein AAFW84_11055 [Cyanobacteria bacterium J06635_15]
MSPELTTHDIDAIAAEAEQYYPPVTSVDQLETTYTESPMLGSGHRREIELCPGLELGIFNFVLHDLTERVPENEHLVQFTACLSGMINSGDYLGGDDLQISASQGYVGGSGIQPRHFVRFPRSHHQIGVEIHMTPALFQQFFATANRELPATLQPLVRGNDCQYRFSPWMTGAM